MFEEYEQQLLACLKRTEVPVLGLLGGLVPSEARAMILAELQVLPNVKAFIHLIDQYPALFGVWLAEHVMLGLGQDGHFSLYPYLQTAIGGIETLNVSERELLWRAFRNAMFKLGIQPLPRESGRHYMVDEYIRQAGVPIAFADDLANRMIHMAKHIGLPDEDDQEGLMTWQSALLIKLVPPFSVTAKKAVERDLMGYYTRTFLRVQSNGGVATTSEVLEVALSKAFSQDVGSAVIKRSSIPQLLYRDGLLGILFFATSRSTAYQLICGGQGYTVHIDEHGAFRPLPSGLHTDVTIQNGGGERLLFTKLWPDTSSNQLLLFNTEGRLRASAQLAQEELVELTPGHYVALCRFEPSNTDNWEVVSESPRLIEVALEIQPGTETVLRNGPASLCIVGHNLPSFKIISPVKGSLERLEFRYAELKALVKVPSDWRQATAQDYEIRVACGAYQNIIPLELDSEGQDEVDLSNSIAILGISPGLHRIVLELGRTGNVRTLQRQSIFYWLGLTSISYGLRFTYTQPPRNVLASATLGVKIEYQCIEPAQEQGHIIRLAFDVGGGRLVYLSWNRPGIFVEVEMPDNGGASVVVPRRLGATETVSLTSIKNIIVSASEPGYITLGSLRTFVDFSQRPSKVFPASFLASRLEPGARTLTYEIQSGGASMPLLELSQPHLVKKVVTSRLANVFEIQMTLSGMSTDISVTGKDLASGLQVRTEHELLAGVWHDNALARMQVYSSNAGDTNIIYVLIDIESLKPGIWILGFGAQISGVWGRLEDAQEGRISVAFAVDQLKKEVSGSLIVINTAELALEEVVVRLGRLNEHFRQYWSPVCWEQQSWLGLYFTALVERLRDHETDFIMELADMAMTRAADDIRQGFFPKQSIPALLNNIFAQQRATYRRINNKAHPLSIVLKAMPALCGAVTPAFGIVLHPCIAMAFQNVAGVMRGARPLNFQLEKFRDVLTQTQLERSYQLDDESFLPNDGELLGPLHLAHAWRDLDRGYTTSLLMPSNRMSAAIALAKLLSQKIGTFDQIVPASLRGKNFVLHLSKPNLDELDDTEQLKLECMDRIANACSWLAWHCRMESRSVGSLRLFHACLEELRKHVQIQGPVLSDCLAYYLHVAPAMFSYYLLLWELVQTIELDHVVQND